MNGKLLRWSDPTTIGACCEIRDLAPQLSNLIYCAPMPDAPLEKVLVWSEIVTEADPEPAFSLDALRGVMPALVLAFVAAHTYSRDERSGGGGEVIDLYDAGCGSVVGRVMELAAIIAIAMHGDAGQRLVGAAHADLSDKLRSIAEFIARR